MNYTPPRKTQVVIFRFDGILSKNLAVFPFDSETKGFCHVIRDDGESFDDKIDIVLDSTYPADIEQYGDFYESLKESGFQLKTLTLNKKGTVQYHRSPNSGEVCFGYGAEHYLEVPFMDVVDEEGNIRESITRNGVRYRR